MSEVAALTLYGIANCDTVRKARAWLAANGVDTAFHDFKKAGLSPALLKRWSDAAGWETLVNRKGTTWRNLPEARRELVTDADAAQALMLEFPSVVKRPVLDLGAQVIVGFDEAHYRLLFAAP
ncbi:MAG: ArsC family reductase [Herminiimonas sp.]|nr:ArsC family reductase [Herminiimonas sp.]